MRTTPALPGDFADYLIKYGWTCVQTKRDGYSMYSKKDLCLVVNGDTVDILTRQPDPGPTKPSMVLLHSFIGWSDLNFLGWTFLMHVMGAVKLTSFFTNVKREVLNGTEPMEDLYKHFRVNENDTSVVPLGY